MSEVITGTLRTVSQAEIGDNPKYDRGTLSAYVIESKLRRIFSQNRKQIEDHLLIKFKIPATIKAKIEDKQEYEEFEIIEILRNKMSDFQPKVCRKLWSIYEEKGLIPVINAIQYLSPLQKI